MRATIVLSLIFFPGCTLLFDGSKHTAGDTSDGGSDGGSIRVDGGDSDAGPDGGGGCEPIELECADGLDGDCDGLVDCEDIDCEELCANCGTAGQLCCAGEECFDGSNCTGKFCMFDGCGGACPTGLYCGGAECLPCDTNDDGLPDFPSAECTPEGTVSLRLVNAHAIEAQFYIAGRVNAIATVPPYSVSLARIPPGDYSFEASTGGRLDVTIPRGLPVTLVAYLSNPSGGAALAFSIHPDPAVCGSDSHVGIAWLNFEFATPAGTADIVESIDGGGSWNPIISGLPQASFSSGTCFNPAFLRLLGVSSPGTPVPDVSYSPEFEPTSGRSFHILMTDANMIAIDDLDTIRTFSNGP